MTSFLLVLRTQQVPVNGLQSLTHLPKLSAFMHSMQYCHDRSCGRFCTQCCQLSCGMVSALPGSTVSVMYQVTMQSWHQMGQHSNTDSSSSDGSISTGSGIQDSGRTVLQAWSAYARHASLLRFLLTEQVATHEVTDCRFSAVTLLSCSHMSNMRCLLLYRTSRVCMLSCCNQSCRSGYPNGYPYLKELCVPETKTSLL